MLKLRHFSRTIFAILIIYMLVLIGALYFVSGRLAGRAMDRMTLQEIRLAVEEGAGILSQAGDAEELDRAVNPAVNPAGMLLILFDRDGQALAVTRGAEKLADGLDLSSLTEETAGTGDVSGFCLMGKRTDEGFVLAGKPLAASERAAFSFRTLMMPYGIMAAVLSLVALFLLAWRIMQPVNTLTDAVHRLSLGEQAQVSEKLPMELRPLGRAFNEMSHRLSSSVRDLTNERDTLSRVLESLDEGVIAVDRDGDILRENRAASRLLGGRGTPLHGQVISSLRRTAQGEASSMNMQAGERTLLAVFRPLPAGNGALAVLRDVTEHERLEKTRREYVANISHELRTPLSSMRGITEGLRDGLVTKEEDRQRMYDLLLGQEKRLSRLVSDLLELSNLQSSREAFAADEADPMEILYEMMDFARPLAREKGVELELDAPETLPVLYTNEDRLQQVLTILTDNAVKFTPAGGRVTLGAHPAGRYVRFSVTDTGIGMDEYTLRHAFDRFHQADTSHSEKGSGLGLAIAQEIMRRMGGHIVVRSAPGEGSEFAFLVRTRDQAPSSSPGGRSEERNV